MQTYQYCNPCEKNYSLPANCGTYRLAKHSPRYDDTVSSCVTKLVNMDRFIWKSTFSIINTRYRSLVFLPHLRLRVTRIKSTRVPQCEIWFILSKKQLLTRWIAAYALMTGQSCILSPCARTRLYFANCCAHFLGCQLPAEEVRYGCGDYQVRRQDTTIYAACIVDPLIICRQFNCKVL